jgi:hypothetical protein
LAQDVANISAVEIPSPDDMSPCGGFDRVSYEERGINGEVRLFAYLDWNGKISGIAVISGLPEGLTEEAIKAAKVSKFVAARSCGQAVTEPVQIHYEFPSGRSKLVRL